MSIPLYLQREIAKGKFWLIIEKIAYLAMFVAFFYFIIIGMVISSIFKIIMINILFFLFMITICLLIGYISFKIIFLLVRKLWIK